MMISRKDTPAPPMQHRDAAAPPSLSPAAKSSETTPQTPRNKIRTKRASKVHRPAPRETYIENNARSVADENNIRNERISHDLSLTDNARHSVVDNMLMSLNPDQPKLFTPPKDCPPFSAGSEPAPPLKSAPRHLHSSSVTSDFNFPSDESPNRFPNQYPRGRRSNSSSNFRPGLRRIDSVHGEGEAAGNTKAKVYQAQRAGGVDTASRLGRKNSNSSGSSSLDFGQMMGQSRFPPTFARRSASFDNGQRSRELHSASSSVNRPPLASSLSQPILYDDRDAAPTPTIPGGPRKDRSSAFPQQPIHAPQIAPAPQGKNNNKTSKSHPNRKKKGETATLEPPVPIPSSTLRSRRASKQVAPTPGFMRSSNPSPVRQYSEPLMATRQDSVFLPKDTSRERPGFFRRVFGSSRGPALTTSDLHPPQIHPLKVGTQTNAREAITSSHKLCKPPPANDAWHLPPEATQPPLAKKTSSFFRRRKKSVSEINPLPSIPVHLKQNRPPAMDRERSPVSSLRQVMNPYLDNPLQQPRDAEARNRVNTSGHDNRSMMSSTLLPKKSAESLHRNYEPRYDVGANLPLHQPRDTPSPTPENPSDREFLRPNDTSSRPLDNSFFHDDSGNETRIPDATDSAQLSRHDTVRLDQTPATFPAKIASRKENFDPRTKSQVATEQSYQRSMDSPRHALSSRNSNVPSPHASESTPLKAEAREWFTPSQLTPSRNRSSPPGSSGKSDRVWLKPAYSEEDLRKVDLSFPIETSEVSPISDYHSASSTLPPLRISDDIHFPEPTAEDEAHKLSVDIDPSLPTEVDITQAKQVYDGDESLTGKEEAAAWLGEPGPERMRVRLAYMKLFAWQNLNILAALRGLCGRLYLKGEAQQVDRILDAFSTRWCTCNPNHGFKATDVVHTICYSVLLLNTDLHQAEIETKMTRTQFLKNILPTIRRVVIDAAPDAFTSNRASTLPPPRPWAEPTSGAKSPTFGESREGRRSFEGQRPIYRLSQRPSDQTAYTSTPPHTPLDFTTSLGDCGPLVKTGFHGKLSTWENQIDLILKDFYNSIRQQPLPLYGVETKEPALEPAQSSTNLSTITSNMVRRTPSMLSKAGSENMSYSRGRAPENRLGTGRWQSKTRSRPRLYPASTVASSRRSSFDEQSSVTSPSVTSAWSRFSSLGKTQTTLSTESFGSHFPQGDYQQSIGFANALSQAIIREEGTGGDEESLRAAPFLDDESLELAGAPWAKEGILKHKHHLESVDRRAKDRNWVESFAVIEKGYLRLFSFSMNAKSLRQKAKNQRAHGGVLGGGNWADSAETLGSFLLRQTIASTLPPPGYSKTRPHVWALSLPTGAVHFFQAGTPEIVKEFVTTANYWSARLSKEPLVGGISNIEYGWGDSVINAAVLHTENSTTSSVFPSTGARPSLQSSIRSARSSIDQGSYRPKLPGDKVLISDWSPPQQSMVASVLMEVDQLKGLSTYVKNIEDELQKHNELRVAMLLAFSPRHPNSAKAMTNWERKSSYLLHEIVKFRTYIDCLQTAQAQKEKIHAERGKFAPTEGENLEQEADEADG